ncbi:hypothetical protein [Streptomyces sp. KR80]|uniref:hypothetical protein n=1 Tax=Streptomyces sp. KR80 TaxID=3457426 RepID=UPI003FD5EC9F
MTEPKPSMCYRETHTTKFNLMDLDTLKAMVAGADPGKVETVADNWKWINERLVGGSDGGLKKEFDDAVEEVLEHWNGAAAEAFRKRAKLISTNIANAAPYAKNVENAMRGAAAGLREYKKQLDAIEKPSGAASAADAAGNYGLKIVTLGAKGGRDDSKANSEIAAGKRTEDVLNGNAGELSEGKERQLQGAMVMEYLGASYRSNAKAIGTPPGKIDDEVYPSPPDNSTSVPPVVPVPTGVGKPKAVAPTATPTAKGPGYSSPNAVTAPRPNGITGGVGTSPKPTGPQVGTGLDGLSGGSSGLGTGAGLGRGGLGGGSVGGGPGGAGTGSGPVGMPGMPGAMAGGPARGGAGTGARSGRAGMPGMGGGAGAGAGAGGAKGAGRGSSLARQRGGIVGAAQGKSAAGGQGGSGLHRSRGGSQAGKPGTGRGPGMMGAPGAHGANTNEDKGRGQRPDYLVEDEETWTPERNVAPRVIE